MSHLRFLIVGAALGFLVAASPACGPAPAQPCASSCAGCCDEGGTCLPGGSRLSCGQAGAACSACAGDQVCVRRQCVAPNTGGGAGGGQGGGGGGEADGGADAGDDAGSDGGLDAGDDGGTDAGSDGGADADGGLDAGTDAGVVDAGVPACTTDVDCGAGKMCHPLLRTCLSRCLNASDCPVSSPLCLTLDGLPPASAGGVATFCQCATNAQCGGGLVCQVFSTRLCAAPCVLQSDCPNPTRCETATGLCSPI